MLTQKLQTLPELPGCYLMRNQLNEIIYVGKAINLKHRVNSYFNRINDYKTTQLVKQITDFDFIITNSEKESLLLEINLIKKYRPRFNIMFMDDKSYPYLKLSNEVFPTLTVVRELKKDPKSTYYGPYPNSKAANLTAKIINEIFPLKKCKVMPKKVCLYYHLGQCLGMCEYPVDQMVYDKIVDQVTDLLKHSQQELKALLLDKMNHYSQQMQYEQAKQYRDYLQALEYVVDRQNVEFAERLKVDLINYAIDRGMIAIQVLMIRDGKLLDKISHIYPVYDLQDAMETFILQLYEAHLPPQQVILPVEVDITNLQASSSIKFVHYQRGKFTKLLELAKQNATQNLKQRLEIQSKDLKLRTEAIIQLNQLLGKDIHRIEIFDNSHLGGTHNVSAMVVAEDGEFNRKAYRLYNLKTAYQSDLESFREVLYRRYQKALVNGEMQPCDLVIVDGGWQQIKVAKQVLESLNMELLVVGLAKDDQHQTASLINDSGHPLTLKHDSEAFRFLTQLQDEVHRFVISHHQRLRSKAMVDSTLDHIPNIGPKRKALLLKSFKSFANIKKQTLEQLIEIIGIKSGQQLYDYLHSGQLDDIIDKVIK